MGTPENVIDMIFCTFNYNGDAAFDRFNCYDRYSISTGTPPSDTIDNIIASPELTQKRFYTVNSVKYIEAAAVFSRLLDTGDITQDYRLRDGDRITSVWAYGTITDRTTLNTHGAFTTTRGRF